MENYSSQLKELLLSIVSRMDGNKQNFIRNPSRDFTRKRKISFTDIFHVLLGMGSSCIFKELYDFYSCSSNTVTTSAFIQARDKVLPAAFKYLFQVFSATYDDWKTHKGYRLLAVDGSRLELPRNPNDPITFVNSCTVLKGYNYMHLNAMYDLCNNLYSDICIDLDFHRDERKALIHMLEHSLISEDAIVIMDRGYAGYNVMAAIENHGWKYVLRVNAPNSSSILKKLSLPDSDEFDTPINLIITNKWSKKIKTNSDLYRYTSNSGRKFDYYDSVSREYDFHFRVIKIQNKDDNEPIYILTNLDSLIFSLDDIKDLYKIRWGIESSFRDLKYSVGLNYFHSTKAEHIVQEVYSRIIMYNFTMMIAGTLEIHRNMRKYRYQINFSIAIFICVKLIKYNDGKSPPDVEKTMKSNVVPIRPGRSYRRKMPDTKPTKSLNYRY